APASRSAAASAPPTGAAQASGSASATGTEAGPTQHLGPVPAGMAPPGPVTLGAFTQRGSTLSVGWRPVAGAAAYTVVWTDADTGAILGNRTVARTTDTAGLVRDGAAHTYRVEVAAVN